MTHLRSNPQIFIANITTSPLLKRYFWHIFLPFHFVLGLLIEHSRTLATIHALIVLGIGIAVMLVSTSDEIPLYIIAYVLGAEVLWRVAQAAIFWESGKYMIILLMTLRLLRQIPRVSLPILPIGFFLLLLPSTFLTLTQNLPFTTLRENLSLNLSGPLTLTMAGIYFANYRPDANVIKQTMMIIAAPVFATSAVTLDTTILREVHSFEVGIQQVYGGFQNQVSSMLGLGAFLVINHAFLEHDWRVKTVLTALGVGLLAQATMTFSRGGLYLSLSAILVALFFQIRQSEQRLRLIAIILVVLVLLGLLLLVLSSQTKGALAARFLDFGLSARDRIVVEDILLWIAHPLLGVGTGNSKYFHAHQELPHTEYTRLLAEHGLFGFLANITLLLMVAGAVVSTQKGEKLALLIPVLVWSLLYMTINGMRLAVPGYFVGLVAGIGTPGFLLSGNREFT